MFKLLQFVSGSTSAPPPGQPPANDAPPAPESAVASTAAVPASTAPATTASSAASTSSSGGGTLASVAATAKQVASALESWDWEAEDAEEQRLEELAAAAKRAAQKQKTVPVLPAASASSAAAARNSKPNAAGSAPAPAAAAAAEEPKPAVAAAVKDDWDSFSEWTADDKANAQPVAAPTIIAAVSTAKTVKPRGGGGGTKTKSTATAAAAASALETATRADDQPTADPKPLPPPQAAIADVRATAASTVAPTPATAEPMQPAPAASATASKPTPTTSSVPIPKSVPAASAPTATATVAPAAPKPKASARPAQSSASPPAASTVPAVSYPPFLSAPAAYRNRDNPMHRAHINFVRLLKRCERLAFVDPTAVSTATAAASTNAPNAKATRQLAWNPKSSVTASVVAAAAAAAGGGDRLSMLGEAKAKSAVPAATASSLDHKHTSSTARPAAAAAPLVPAEPAVLNDEQRTKFFQYLSSLSEQLEALKQQQNLTAAERDELSEYGRQLAFLTEMAERERKAVFDADPSAHTAIIIASTATATTAASPVANASTSGGGSGGGGDDSKSSADSKSAPLTRAEAVRPIEKQLEATVALRVKSYIRQKQRQQLFDGKTPLDTTTSGDANSDAAAGGDVYLTGAGEPELGSELFGRPPATDLATPTNSDRFRMHHHTSNPQEDLFTDRIIHTTGVAKRGTTGATVQAALEEERAKQAALTNDLEAMALTLKESAKNISQHLAQDRAVLDQVDNQIDSNSDKVKRETKRLHEHASAVCGNMWQMFGIALICFVAFFFMIIIMKVFAKPK